MEIISANLIVSDSKIIVNQQHRKGGLYDTGQTHHNGRRSASDHPVAADTLQRIRKVTADINQYAGDYRDVGILKALADKYRIAILLVHHLRKMNDDDPMNMIYGTTGISGATDSNFVLKKDKRGGNSATLYCVGRDIEYRELRLEFDNNTHLWSLVSDSITNEPQPSDEIILHLSAVMKSLLSFTGTATELAAELEKHSGEKLLCPMC